MSRSKRTGRKTTTDGGSGSTAPVNAVAVMEPASVDRPAVYAGLDELDKECARLRGHLSRARANVDENLLPHTRAELREAALMLDTLRTQLLQLAEAAGKIKRS